MKRALTISHSSAFCNFSLEGGTLAGEGSESKVNKSLLAGPTLAGPAFENH